MYMYEDRLGYKNNNNNKRKSYIGNGVPQLR